MISQARIYSDCMIYVLSDGNLDLENFGKKKKKKKKPFNMEELDGAIPESGNKSKEEGNMEIDGNQDEGLVEVLQYPVCYF